MIFFKLLQNGMTKNITHVFMLKNFLENMVVKEFNNKLLTQSAFSCSKLGK